MQFTIFLKYASVTAVIHALKYQRIYFGAEDESKQEEAQAQGEVDERLVTLRERLRKSVHQTGGYRFNKRKLKKNAKHSITWNVLH